MKSNKEKLQRNLREMGLDIDYTKSFDNIIVSTTPKDNLNVFFDNDYNLIGIEENKDDLELEEIVKNYYEKYSTNKPFAYPFQGYTLKDVINLADRVEVIETNHGHSIATIINGDVYSRTHEVNDFFKLLSYVKFIGESIKDYFKISYPLMLLDIDTKDVEFYIKGLMQIINTYVYDSVRELKRPWASDIQERLGKSVDENDNIMLQDIVDLLITNNGYKIKQGSLDEVEPTPDEKGVADLSQKADRLLRILEIPKEEKEEIKKLNKKRDQN